MSQKDGAATVIIIILAASILLQLSAAVVAFRLIAPTKHPMAWALIAGAMLLMVARRSTTLYNLLSQAPVEPPDLSEETTTLLTSAFLLAALLLIGALFRSIKSSEEALRKGDQELRLMLDQLKLYAEELQQFAYVASHDLQEPLRTMSAYVQLIARRYQGKLDADADEFIGFITDAASRMQALVNDLLSYSRVTTKGVQFQPTDCNSVLRNTLRDLRAAVQEAGASVTYDPLPTVLGDERQLGQVFQNLISNAIKFRSDQPPRVHVSAQKNGDEWVFSVSDNGIGIEPEYFDRVFGVFQRLGRREDYPGTGIGLAVCKKIVERHGGKIWVKQSQPGKGSTFCFALPLPKEASNDQPS